MGRNPAQRTHEPQPRPTWKRHNWLILEAPSILLRARHLAKRVVHIKCAQRIIWAERGKSFAHAKVRFRCGTNTDTKLGRKEQLRYFGTGDFLQTRARQCHEGFANQDWPNVFAFLTFAKRNTKDNPPSLRHDIRHQSIYPDLRSTRECA